MLHTLDNGMRLNASRTLIAQLEAKRERDEFERKKEDIILTRAIERAYCVMFGVTSLEVSNKT